MRLCELSGGLGVSLNRSVFVIDDDEAAGQSLTFLLRTKGFIARGFPSAIAFLKHLEPYHLGCVVTDLRMPGMNGIELVDALRQRGSPLQVIVVTGHGDVPLAVSAIQSGAMDFIEKPFASGQILSALERCFARVAANQEDADSQRERQRRISALTNREREIVDLIVEGKSSKEIAASLEISPRTVETHRANIMEKMQVGNLSSLVRLILCS